MKQQLEKESSKNEICTQFLWFFLSPFANVKLSVIIITNLLSPYILFPFSFFVTLFCLSAKNDYGRLFLLNG